MPVLEISLLGPPVVRCGDRTIVFTARKSAALLYYLAAHPAQPLGRAQLATLLWEEHDEAEGRNSLSTALSRLRRPLSALPFFPIDTAGDSILWQPTPAAPTDLDRFVELTKASPGTGDPRGIETAVALYRGPFLEAFDVRDSIGYAEWVRQERDHWQQRILAAYRDLIDLEQGRERFDAAVLHAQRALAIDPLQEQLHQTLMRLYYQSGDRASAVAQFQTCERLLREGLDVGPSAESRSLRDAIVAGRLPPSASRTSALLAGHQRQVSPRLPPRHGRYRLIGREVELRQLRELLAGTPGRASRLVLVQGEAGIGKTRLIEELLTDVGDPPSEPRSEAPGMTGPLWTVFLGHSYPDAQGLPYHPMIEALRSQLAPLAVDTLPVADVWLAEVNRLLPEITSHRSHLTAPARLDPPQERRRLFEGIAQLLMAFGRPRLFILEDLHWADAETLHLLAYLVRHDRLQDTLFLVTLRPEDVSATLDQIMASLEYEGRLDRVRLGPLSETSTTALIQAIVAEHASGLAEQIYREAEGNPLFAIELARSLSETGARQTRPRPDPLEGMVLPATVQAVIHGRLARLDPSSREYLNSAAVFRRDFDFDEVRAVAGQTEDAALEALEVLLRVQILRETSTPMAAGIVATRYSFSHDQIRRVAYESLSDARRRLLHRRVIELLTPVGEKYAEQLAHHACRAQAWSVALTWSEQAAVDALQLCADESAVHLYEQALACASQLPLTTELRGRMIDLRLQLARAAFYVRPGRLMDWLAPAEAEASQLGDAERLAHVWLAQASALYIQGQFTAALPRLEQLQTIADATGDPALRARTDNTLGRLLVIRGELGRGLAALDRALAAAEPGAPGPGGSSPGPLWSATPLERLVSLGLAACAHAFRGDFARAADTMARSRLLVLAPTDVAARAAAAFYHALIVQTRGDWAATVAYANEAIANARAAASLIYEYVSHVYLGLALARQGQAVEGLAVQQTALALAERAQTRVILGRAHAWLADILVRAGQHQAAYDAALHGEALSKEHGYLLEAAMCARVRGEVCLALDARDEAAAALDQARIDLAALEAWPEWARAEAALGRLHLARGDFDASREHLQRAARRFDEMGMEWDLAQTRSLLAAAPKSTCRVGDG